MKVLKVILNSFFALITSTFGEFSWKAPSWLTGLKRRAQKITLKTFILSLASLGAALGAYFGYEFYLNSLPEIKYTTVETVAPKLTSYPDKKISKLSLRFSTSAAPIDSIGKTLTSGVAISPKIKGSWRWETDQTLTFEPSAAVAFKSDWLVGTTYTVKLERALFPKQVNLKNYSISFKTSDLTLGFVNGRFYIDPKQPELKKAVTTVYSNTPIDTEDIKKRIRILIATGDQHRLGKHEKTLEPKIRFNKNKTEVYIESPNLELDEQERVVTFSIAEGVQSVRGGEKTVHTHKDTVSIPGKFSAFKVQSPKVIYAKNKKFEPEQVLIFETGVDAKTEHLQKKIELFLLPEDHTPPGRGKKEIKRHQWSSVSEVTQEVIASSQPVSFKTIASERAYSNTHSIKLDLPPNRFILFKVKKGAKGYGGFELKTDESRIVQIPKQQPEVLFMSEGALLTLSGDLQIPILSRAVKKIKYKINRTLPSQNNFLISKILDGNDFSNPASLYDHHKHMIMETFEESEPVPARNRTGTHYTALNLKPYVKKNHGFYYVEASAERSYISANKMVLVTDLGLIAKKSQTTGKTMVFVQNLRTGKPVPSAKVTVIGQNGLSILEKTTDEKGLVSFLDLKDFQNEKRPLAYTATKNGDTTYLPYRMYDRQLDYSRFEVGGVHKYGTGSELSAMIFSDRGLYRPGDQVNIGLIVKSIKNIANAGIPLSLNVTNPRGKNIYSTIFKAVPNVLKDFTFKTQSSSPTGQYTVSLKLIKKNNRGEEYQVDLESLYVSIEEFQPDKLKIRAHVTPFKSKGWVPLKDLTVKVDIKNMFGSPAQNRIIKSKLTLKPTSPKFKGLEDYTFINPNSEQTQTATEYLKEQTSDLEGKTQYDINLSKYKGYFNIKVETEGFEAAGGKSVDTQNVLVGSHLENLVGFKADGSLGFIKGLQK